MLADALLNAQGTGTAPYLSGKDAFILYDTYGFPVDITKEVAEERGISIDMNSFDIEMDKQRQLSEAYDRVKLAIENGSNLAEDILDTEFIGYNTHHSKALVEGFLVNGSPIAQVFKGSEVEILLNRTPFYAESGGQIGDNDFLSMKEVENEQKVIVHIKDVQKSMGSIFVHKGTITEGTTEVGREVEATVDLNLRKRSKLLIYFNQHSRVIGQETSQAGSMVAFDRLRFDFNFHRPLLDKELVEIEGLINQWIGDGMILETKVMSLTDAKGAGAIAMFGEKYVEQVRVVEVPGVSMELCGGTYVSNTAEIRGFKIISERGIASGIRRIEAVAGDAFIEYVLTRDNYMKQLWSNYMKQLCSTLKVFKMKKEMKKVMKT
ncbi:putative alanine--tRNA ligase, chloroplastic [Capsicum annuum]|nr:putative alanine--tRNA ligase, chloroplastic [Capsicum annuum]KAF3659358.1 putative alanine--tRNA ligase, chloroplastic [Capsicum annuum]